MPFDWRTHVLEVLQATEYGCLATTHNNNVWANPVYFAWDEAFNLYFISTLKTRHMQYLKENSNIAFAIYRTDQETTGDVSGLQIDGHAEILVAKEDVAQAFEIYFARVYPMQHPRYGAVIDNPYAYHPDWYFVRIRPNAAYLFDTRFFGDERQEIPLGDFLL